MRGMKSCLILSFVAGAAWFHAAAQELSPSITMNLGQGESITLKLVKAGSFVQGSPAGEDGREDDEAQREVRLTKDFYMSETVITRGQFERFVNATRFRTEAETGPSGGFGVVDGRMVQQKQFTWRNPGFAQSATDPVTIVSFDDAMAFCRWVSGIAKRDCTLPTEAQWEYACRAGSTGARYSEPVDTVAWHRGNSSGVTHPVKQKPANAWGLYDFYGPVWQWCRDWYGAYAGTTTDPEQMTPPPGGKPRRVLRGGSFMSGDGHSRSAERYRNEPKSRNADNGFRIVATVAARLSSPTPASKPMNQTSQSKASPAAQSSFPNTPAQHQDGVDFSFEHQGSFGIPFMGLGCVGLFVALIAFVIMRVRRAMRGVSVRAAPDPVTHGPSSRFSARVQNDGFWIVGPPGSVGEMVTYRCLIGDTVREEMVSYTPGPEGQFIFTGEMPSEVTIAERDLNWLQGGSRQVGPQGSGVDVDTIGRGIGMASSIGRSSHSSSSSSFPSAY